jgi:hypothetical protein
MINAAGEGTATGRFKKPRRAWWYLLGGTFSSDSSELSLEKHCELHIASGAPPLECAARFGFSSRVLAALD